MSPKPLKRKPPEKPVDNKKAIKNILTLLKDHKAKLIITIVCAIISTAFTIIAPLLIGKSTTIIYEGTTKIINHTGTIDLNSLINLLIIVVVLYVVSALFSYLQSYFIIDSRQFKQFKTLQLQLYNLHIVIYTCYMYNTAKCKLKYCTHGKTVIQ